MTGAVAVWLIAAVPLALVAVRMVRPRAVRPNRKRSLELCVVHRGSEKHIEFVEV